ncbi:polysaccharide deacetylase family protein [Mucilaginibacter sp. 44-25]|uniref:polysaccharide deacetylase family protein n=1 Tax=Mucilaginibacter sp. 44-25 TaxID=1895794 RepID=UPI0009637E51|nr:polysaccharide deacetylase family protein [Mucilaginibacter sp. 44-25]OJW17262.1 MAG: polysaccharide deacetylase [Mucilaginibacter sp. 44-25]
MILLGFDLEEFDLPLELGNQLDFEKQLAISTTGAQAVLELLKALSVKVTFYCTANYAVNRPEIIKQIVDDGHEIASHGYYHSDFNTAHLLQSRIKLEEISGEKVTGFRMARMMPVDEKEIKKAGYLYNSSLNPTWLPGRYNHLKEPRTWFYKDDVMQLPASVSPLMRIPLFWLSFHNLPLALIKRLCAAALKKDGYLNLYFHPWEFAEISKMPELGLPGYITRNSGKALLLSLKDFIVWARGNGYSFNRTDEFTTPVILQTNTNFSNR